MTDDVLGCQGPCGECSCDEPVDLCVESDGKCANPEACKCERGDIALPGW